MGGFFKRCNNFRLIVMPIDYNLYKTTIKQASIAARSASSIDEALEIQAAGYTTAFANAVAQMQVDTQVATTGSASSQTGTGIGTVS